MKIKELQATVADALNGVEELVQGGCKAFAEDSQTVMNDIAQQLTGKAGVAICVVTPTVTKNGIAKGGIAAGFSLSIQCSEKPEINRRQPGHMTALDAAETVALALDGEQFSFIDIRQIADKETRTITAIATFETTIKLSRETKTKENKTTEE